MVDYRDNDESYCCIHNVVLYLVGVLVLRTLDLGSLSGIFYLFYLSLHSGQCGVPLLNAELTTQCLLFLNSPLLLYIRVAIILIQDKKVKKFLIIAL